MSPPLLQELDQLIARTRRRLALRKLVRGGSIGLHLGVWVVAIGALVLSQVVHPKHLLATTGLMALVVLGVVLGLSASITLLGRRLRKREVALLLDRSLDQDEVYVTAAWLGENPDLPNRDALLAQLSPDEPRKLSDALAIRFPRHLRFAILPLLLVGLAFFVPRVINPLQPSTPVETEGERLAERLREVEEEVEGAELPEELIGEVAELADELTGDSISEEEAVERINDLQKQLEQLEEQLQPSESMLDQLEEAADKLGDNLPDLKEALEQADMEKAAEALENLADDTKQLTPEQKQQVGEAMRQAGQSLRSASDPSMQGAGEALEAAGQELEQQGTGQQGQGQQGQGQQGENGQQGEQGQQGTGQQGAGEGGLSQERVEQLQEQLRQAQQVSEQLQQDGKALERAQRINGALEASKQRLGGEASEQQGESSQGQGQQGADGQGQGQDDGQGSGQQQGQGNGQGGDNQGQGQGPANGAGNGHTWEDEGESFGQQEFQDSDRNDASRTDASNKHIDDFQRLYDPDRLQNVDALIASEKGQIDEQGHQDVLPTRRTGSEETSGQKLVDAPETYTRAAQDAIANETVPPGYRNAVKQYFDQME